MLKQSRVFVCACTCENYFRGELHGRIQSLCSTHWSCPRVEMSDQIVVKLTLLTAKCVHQAMKAAFDTHNKSIFLAWLLLNSQFYAHWPPHRRFATNPKCLIASNTQQQVSQYSQRVLAVQLDDSEYGLGTLLSSPCKFYTYYCSHHRWLSFLRESHCPGRKISPCISGLFYITCPDTPYPATCLR